jgi:hypothetical protein
MNQFHPFHLSLPFDQFKYVTKLDRTVTVVKMVVIYNKNTNHIHWHIVQVEFWMMKLPSQKI